MSSILVFVILWVAWMISWAIAAMWASRPQAKASARDEWPYRLITFAGALLLIINFRAGRSALIWTGPDWIQWLLVAVAALGLAFTWWARIELGTLWSGRVTRKADHRIIDTGPYRLVRHPIYTGILIAIWAAALLRPGLLGIAGAAVLTVSFVVKLRLEERFLMQELGAEAYTSYRARVPMLVPFWPTRS